MCVRNMNMFAFPLISNKSLNLDDSLYINFDMGIMG